MHLIIYLHKVVVFKSVKGYICSTSYYTIHTFPCLENITEK